jgi:hypothetical protein
LHPVNKPVTKEALSAFDRERFDRNIFIKWGLFMANQQNKKDQPAQTTGTSSATGGPDKGTVPAVNQNRPNDASTTPHSMGASSSTNPRVGSSTPTTEPAYQSEDRSKGDQLSASAGGILDKAKETASGTYDAVATKATNKIEERKGELSTGLKTVADTFRKTGSELRTAPHTTPLTDLTARYSGTAANQIEKAARYFERHDVRAMMRDAEGFARRNPAIFLGAAFALGMLAARFLKSSPPDNQSTQSSMNSVRTPDMHVGTGLPSNMPTNP